MIRIYAAIAVLGILTAPSAIYAHLKHWRATREDRRRMGSR